MRLINIACVLTTLNLFSANLGCYSQTSYRFYGLLSLLLMGIINLSICDIRKVKEIKLIIMNAIVLFVSLLFILKTNYNQTWLLILPVFIYFFDNIIKNFQVNRGEFPPLLITSFTYSILFLMVRYIPDLWYLIQNISLSLSAGIGKIMGNEVVLGASASGMWILLSFFIYFITIFLIPNRKNRILVMLNLIYSIFIYVIYIVFGENFMFFIYKLCQFYLRSNYTVPIDYHINNALIAANSPIIFFIVGLLLIMFFSKRFDMDFYKSEDKKAFVTLRMRNSLAIQFLVFVGFFILTLFPYHSEKKNPRITFYNKGIIEWNLPNFDRFGINQSGMFGLLPKYLTAMGFNVKIMERDADLTKKTLDDTDIFVVINPTKFFSLEQKEPLWQFIAKGGSLLVMGDHTDIGGIRSPLNDLLSPVNIYFNFDSAFTATHWVNSYELFPHPIIRGLDFADDKLQQSTGASIQIESPAFPIISGKFAFSDIGDRSNRANAYLGDYRYQLGEQMGDVVIVGGAHYGKGKVLVFGDTSPFQNTAIYHSYEFIGRVFSYLSCINNNFLISKKILLFSFLFLVVLIIGVKTGYFLKRKSFMVLSLVIFLSCILTQFINYHIQESVEINGPLAYVDASHINRYSLEHWKKDSIGGLTLNLARNGYIPLIHREGNLRRILNACVYLSIAPSKPFSKSELDLLKKFMEKGGLLILSVGWEEKKGSENILSLANLDISHVPLGPFPIYKKTLDNELIRLMQTEPHFMEVWPIINKDQQPIKIFYQADEFPVIIFKKVGKGGILLISDTMFFYDKTLEEEKAWWEGNIMLLKRIFNTLKNEGIAT